MCKGKFKNSDLQGVVWKTTKHDWVARFAFLIQILLIFGGYCNHYLWDIQLKFYSLPKFNILFQLVLTKVFKSKLFRVYWKLITWSTNARGLFYTTVHVNKCTRWQVFSLATSFNRCPPFSTMNEVANSIKTWIQDKNTVKSCALAAPGSLWTLPFAIGWLENLTFLI